MKLPTMARSTSAQQLGKLSSKLSIAGLVGATITFGIASSVVAQTLTNSQPGTFSNTFPNADGSSDPFSNRGEGQASGVMDLIHRAMQGSSKGAAEFNAEQGASLDSAAAQFRAKQQELLRQSSPPSVAPVVPSPSSK